MKCSACGKEIKNAYYLDGKIYGYSCYKMAVALKYATLEELKNDDYARKCNALIEVYNNKEVKGDWNINFKNSILKQWNECKKLTAKQFDCIVKKFNEVEHVEYNLTYYIISRQFSDDKEKFSKENYIYDLFKSDILKVFKNDERLHDFIKDYKSASIKRGKKFYIVESKDEDEPETYFEILRESELQNLKNDEDVKILGIQEV